MHILSDNLSVLFVKLIVIFDMFCSGYMPPEYVANGQFSMKSDVYSFGVLILEIIGGKKNSSFHKIDGSLRNLVTYVSSSRPTRKLKKTCSPFSL